MYATAEEVIAYASQRGLTLEPSVAGVHAAVASTYLDTAFDYVGLPTSDIAAFPRTETGNALYDGVIPPPVKLACIMVAYDLARGVQIEYGAARSDVTRERVSQGAVEVYYANTRDDYGMAPVAIHRPAEAILEKAHLLANSGGIYIRPERG